ncbi:MAG: Crp/Fnr family transcriptional regulator, partial [Rhodoferax sp.]
MFTVNTIDPRAQSQNIARGQRLLQRGGKPVWVSYIESGRVALGVLDDGLMEHQIGVLEGPCWLDASSAVLNMPH